ncbi:Six-hairpin glycosidase [Byssothecium circinans]|uniref:Six-hairpin glycosidase n=1 Tax=Byssothecium circinans TaxID=147558 RepID=A0A6A5U9Y8_9PLEO|nr:Six-hairpin glycosidase [Byssothecium circinans]
MIFFVSTVVIAALRGVEADGFVDYGNVHYVKYGISNAPSNQGLQESRNESIVLSPGSPFLTLDYDTEVAGFAIFDVKSVSGPSQVEVKYAEDYLATLEPESDGPFTFSAGLSNTFRVETFNITNTGYTESFLLQGGQRWETVKLLSNATIMIARVGFRSTSQLTPADQLPGVLKTDNNLYNGISELGGHTVQIACVDAGNAPSTWEISSDGALIRGQASAQSVFGQKQANYTLNFDTKIVRGGTGWKVATSLIPFGPYFVLTSEYPEHNTLLDTNRTRVPPNTLIFNYGWGFLNQTGLVTGWNEYYPVNITISEGKWYRVSTIIEETGYRIQINSQTVAFVPIFQAAFKAAAKKTYYGTSSPYLGTWGFGGFQDQISYTKNVSVTVSNGTQVYYNSMTNNDTLAEYGVAPLDHSICLDGGKRDRLVWIGDFYHTVRIIAQSTARWGYLLGTIDYAFSFQLDNGTYAGFVPISANMGTRSEDKEAYSSVFAGLNDYQDLFLAGIADYFHYTNDVQGLYPYWAQIKKLASARLAFVDPNSGLVGNSPSIRANNFLGPVNGSATTSLFAYALQRLVPLAEAFNDTAAVNTYTEIAQNLRDAINTHLWNEGLGTYSLSVDSPGNFSITGIAWAILSGAANTTQATSSLSKLEEVRLGIGYKTISSDADAENYQLSPNLSGFLLEALFQTQRSASSSAAQNATTPVTAITHLLDNLWGSMLNPTYKTGAPWEYVTPNGLPGLGLYTSLAHPWSGAPTYILPEYLLGVRATEPGYASFEVTPLIGYLGLKEVNGTVPTPNESIEVGWKLSGKNAVIDVKVPAGTKGLLKLPEGVAATVDGKGNGNGTVELKSGAKSQVILQLP